MTAPAGLNDELRRAEGLLEMNRPADALAVLTVAAATAPDSVTVHCLIARCHSDMGNYAGMLRAATEATKQGPRNEWGHRLRATALRKLGRDHDAVRAAATAVELDPFHWYTHAALAESLLSMESRENRKRAYDAAKTALTIAPQMSNTHITMGRVLQSIGEHRAARVCFERAIGLNPADSAGYTNLASVDLERGRILSAGRGLRGVAASNPGVAMHADNVRVAAGRWLIRFLDVVTLACYLQFGLATFVPQPFGGIAGLAAVAVVLGISAVQVARMPAVMRSLVTDHVRAIDTTSRVAHLAFFALTTWWSIAAIDGDTGSWSDTTAMVSLFLCIVMVSRFRGRISRYWRPFRLRRRYRRAVLGADARSITRQRGAVIPQQRPAPSSGP